MANDKEKNELAERFLAGLRHRDWNVLRSIMTEDIIWSLPRKQCYLGVKPVMWMQSFSARRRLSATVSHSR